MLKQLIITKQKGYTTVAITRYLDNNKITTKTYAPSFASCTRVGYLIEPDSEYRKAYSLESWFNIYAEPESVGIIVMFSVPEKTKDTLQHFEGNYTRGVRETYITNVMVGKYYILENEAYSLLVKVTESAVNSKDHVERVTYNIIDPETGKRGLMGFNNFDFTLWDFAIAADSSEKLYRAVAPRSANT